jgi:hypothetical protein
LIAVIISDSQLTDMTSTITGIFPVIAVAFYVVRIGPDDLRDISDEKKRIPIPEKWARGWRLELLHRLTPTYKEMDEDNPSIPFAEDYRLGADRSFLLTFTPGMIASLASLTLRHWPIAAHLLSATALLLLVLTIRSFVLFASQTAMLRLAVLRSRTAPSVEYPRFFLLGDSQKTEFIPFNSLIQTNMVLSLAIVSAIALAVIIVIGAFI